LFFVEDPGAANYVAPLVTAALECGMTTRLLGGGPAIQYLRDRGTPVEAVPPDISATALLNLARPGILVTGTSEDRDALGLALIDAARELSVPSVGAVDGSANSAFRFRGHGDDSLFHAPTWLMVPDDWTKVSYTKLGFPEQRVAVCGHPQYDVVLRAKAALDSEGRTAVRSRLLPAARNRSVVVFLTELSVGLNSEQFRRSSEYTLIDNEHDLRTEVVLDEFLNAVAVLPDRPYLVLRVHPKDRISNYPIQSRAFDLVSESGSPLELVYAADLIVGMTSMLLLEATLLGRLTLSIVPRPIERDWLPSIRWGLTPCAHDRAEVRAQLTSLLRRPDAVVPHARAGLPSERSTDLGITFLKGLLRDR
jgi:hypothetical protein